MVKANKGATAPAKGATAPTTAPTTAPATATTTAPIAAVALAKGNNANNGNAVAVALQQGQVAVCTVQGGVWHVVAPHTVQATTCNPAAWPPCYTSNNGTQARKPGAPQGAAGMPAALHAVHVPATGPAVWGMVHYYAGMRSATSSAAASNPGNNTMVFCPAPVGAVVHGVPGPRTVAMAKALGLAPSTGPGVC